MVIPLLANQDLTPMLLLVSYLLIQGCYWLLLLLVVQSIGTDHLGAWGLTPPPDNAAGGAESPANCEKEHFLVA